MTEWYHREDVDLALRRVLRAMGAREAEDITDVGGYYVGYANGGYRIERVVSPSGDVDTPFGGRRMSARELVQTLEFAEQVMRQYQLSMSTHTQKEEQR